MKPRLDELLRQRELMREHLRWLENEIAGEQGEALAKTPLSDQSSTPSAPSPPVVPAAATTAPTADLEPLPEPDVRSLESEVRSGCLIYAVILFGSLAALVGFIYWKY